MGYLDKVIRKPVYKKSNISGMVKDYQKIYDIINNWNKTYPPTQIIDGKPINEEGHYLYGMRYSMNDAPYFGWTGEVLNEERRTFNAVEKAYTEMLFAIEDALGIESEVYVSKVDENGYYKTK